MRELRHRIATEGLPKISPKVLRLYKREEPHSARLGVGLAMTVLAMLA